MVKTAVALVVGVLPLVWAGMYGQPVVNLDAKTFKTVMATEHAGMVAFVAPWCGHCKNLGPEYIAAAQSLAPLIPFYAVDCDTAENKPLCVEYGVKGFPTIKAFPRAGRGAARDYNGERKRGPLMEYAKALVPDRVKKLRVEDGVDKVVQKFLGEKPDLAHALLIHPSSPSIPFLWKVLGHRFSTQMHLGYIRDSPSHGLASSLGVYDAADTSHDPTRLVYWQPESPKGQLAEYDGVMKFNALLEWLQAQLDDTAASNAKHSKSSGTSKDARQAKLDEAEKRDNARGGKQSTGSKVEDAPDAVPAEGVLDTEPSYDESDLGQAAAPEPEAQFEVDENEGSEPLQTGVAHEEL